MKDTRNYPWLSPVLVNSNIFLVIKLFNLYFYHFLIGDNLYRESDLNREHLTHMIELRGSGSRQPDPDVILSKPGTKISSGSTSERERPVF